MKILCYLEAMNLDNIFRDCQDLSTIRGGGLSVLNIANPVIARVSGKAISAGASQGLFTLEANSCEKAEEWVRKGLGEIPILRHTTIMTSALEYDEQAFSRQRAELKAMNRWKQMRSASVVYPELLGNEVCGIDRIRPGRRREDLEEKEVQSDFTAERRAHGKKEKAALLQQILGKETVGTLGIVKDLTELSDGGGKYGNLDLKVAVLRFDGNSFGNIVKSCSGPKELGEFSVRTRDQQEEFFRRLVATPGFRNHGWKRGSAGWDKLRLEILVYGGDEVTFVVPAWLGWEALHCFYETAREWPEFGGWPVSYSGGVVFANHKVPIHAVRDLGSALADEAKDRRTRAGLEKGNLAAYQVLESFDSVGTDVSEFLDSRFGKVGIDGILMGAATIQLLHEEMSHLRACVGRRQLHRLARKLVAGEVPKTEKDQAAARKALLEGENERAIGTLGRLEALLGWSGYLHLLELWDYAGVDLDRKEK